MSPVARRGLAAAGLAVALLVGVSLLALGRGSPATGGTCVPAGTTVCLTRAAGGRVEHVRRGVQVTLTLGNGTNLWGPPLLGGRGLAAVGEPARLGRGYVAHYRATEDGTATIQATERPYCPPGTACPQYILLWRTEVVVSR
ncbi:MAG TPA: hypothetical protein VNF07_04680 [Acidimicrobiales bacterium]|nr:hypothetical protein [Acidimicrobiales bacterium]